MVGQLAAGDAAYGLLLAVDNNQQHALVLHSIGKMRLAAPESDY
jgi:hypothetical protein